MSLVTTMSVRKFLGKSCQGTIKSFVLEKRYGFISGDQFKEDVFVNYKLCPNLEAYGDAMCAGARVTFVPVENPSKKGVFEAKVCELDDVDLDEVDSNASIGKWVDATVKSWCADKGYGFLTCSKAASDIMMGVRKCPNLKMMPLQKGMVVRARFTESTVKPGTLEATDVEPKRGAASSGMGMQPAMMRQLMPQPQPQLANQFDMGQMFSMFMNMVSGGAMGGMNPAMGAMMNPAMGQMGSFGPVRAGGKAAGTPGPYASPKSKKFVGRTVTGTIKSFNTEKGWGFLSSKSFPDDCFFNIKLNPHLGDVKGELSAGIPATYTVQEGRGGALEAVEVEV